MSPVPVLDHGFVDLIEVMGSDLTVVNAARVSHNKRSSWLNNEPGMVSPEDQKLIRYLAKNKHMSPFRHVQFQFHIKCPEFVARQWYKHCVGIAYSEGPVNDHAWNEISMRYVEMQNADFHYPTQFRAQSETNKQGSEGAVDSRESEYLYDLYHQSVLTARRAYQQLIEAGVAREQARMALPMCIYTEFFWTTSLPALVNFIKLRDHPAAQAEIIAYAKALRSLAGSRCPVTMNELLKENAE